MNCNHRPPTTGQQQGFTILESLVVIGVMISFMGLGAGYLNRNAQQAVDRIAARQLKQVTQAAHQYLQDHYNSFNGGSSTTSRKDWVEEWLQQSSPSTISSIPSITFEILQKKGYLSEQVKSENCYGQRYKIEVKPMGGGNQQQLLITTEGGQQISEHSLRAITHQVGGSSGYTSVLHPGIINGSQDSWSLQMARGAPWEQGHLASLMIVNRTEVMDAATFLRRTKMDGHPEYNTMESDLTIDNHLLMLTGNNTQAKFSSKTLTLGNPLGKPEQNTISLDINGNPIITVKNGQKTWSTEITPSEIRLESQASGNKSYIGNEKIELHNNKTWSTAINPAEIRLESQATGNKSYVANNKIELHNNKTWSTEINPAEIRLESQATGNKSYIGNDSIELHNKTWNTNIWPGKIVLGSQANSGKQINLDVNSGWVSTSAVPIGWVGSGLLVDNRGTFSQVTDLFVKVPYFELQAASDWIDERLNLCGSKDKEGRLYLVGEKGKSKRRLAICANGKSRSIETW